MRNRDRMDRAMEALEGFDWITPLCGLAQMAMGRPQIVVDIPPGWSCPAIVRVLRRAGCRPRSAQEFRGQLAVIVNDRERAEAALVRVGVLNA